MYTHTYDIIDYIIVKMQARMVKCVNIRIYIYIGQENNQLQGLVDWYLEDDSLSCDICMCTSLHI